ncbi:MAG: endolytic transglycosylase MltG [Spirochaetaceae bacterium]|nr:MAG: endolytic transglycosylase MltG [Spirochaetaceae bacterium]
MSDKDDPRTTIKDGEQPRSTRRPIRIIIAVLLLGLVAAGVVGAVAVRARLFTPVGATGEFVLERGRSLRYIAGHLEQLGKIPDGDLLVMYARLARRSASIQAGTYALDETMTPVSMLDMMIRGETVDLSRPVTIPEGWRITQIAARLEAAGIVTADQFEAAATMREAYRDVESLADLPDGITLEGFLFPETYRFNPESGAEEVVLRMLRMFETRVNEELREKVAEQGRTMRDVVNLAAIVQAESPVRDMPEIAGVFWSRLRIGMRLESDATVNYFLGTSKLQPTLADIRVRDPYNTYLNAGLPPGPIGNPGIDAIRAAIEPAEHEYLFFLHKPTLETVFSRNFTEHLAAKARYLD